MHAGRERFLQSCETLARNRTYGRALNQEHGPAPRKESGDLPALDAANFDLIRADGKNGSRGGLAKFASVFRFAAEDGPADAGAGGSFGDLRERRGAERFNND